MTEESTNARLSLLNQHIAQTEQRVADQSERIGQLTAKGYDASNSRDLLCTMQETLHTLQEQRRVIEGLVQARQERRKVLK